MSWWDTNSFSSFASQALKNAQKKIDKVLDIQDSEARAENASKESKDAPKGKEKSSWNSWLSVSTEDKDDDKEEEEEDGGRSSWSMPWGMDTSFTRQFSPAVKSKKSPQIEKDTSSKLPKDADVIQKAASMGKEEIQKAASMGREEIQKAASMGSEELLVPEETLATSSAVRNEDKKIHTDEESLDTGEGVRHDRDIIESKSLDQSQGSVQGESRDNKNTRVTPRNDTMTVRTAQDDVTSNIQEKAKVGENVGFSDDRQVNFIPVNVDKQMESTENFSDTSVVKQVESTGELSDMASSEDQQSFTEPEANHEENISVKNISESVDLSNLSVDNASIKESETSQLNETESIVSSVHKDREGSEESERLGNTAEKREEFQCDIQLSDLMLSSERSQEDSTNTAEQTEDGGGRLVFSLGDSASLEDNDQAEGGRGGEGGRLVSSLEDASSMEDKDKTEDGRREGGRLEDSASLEDDDKTENGRREGGRLEDSASQEDDDKTKDGRREEGRLEDSVSLEDDDKTEDGRREGGRLEDSASVEDNDQTEGPFSSSSNNIHNSFNTSVSSYFDSVTEDKIPHTDDDSNRVSTLPLSPSTTSSLGGTDSDTNKLDSSLDAYTSDDTVVDKGGEEQVWSKVMHRAESPDCVDNQQSTADQADTEEPTQQDLASLEKEGKEGSSGSVSPSSSYVKCMIEEAMDDNASDTHSNGGEKSECSRSTGGHDSGDEISTTTSSDIEIISTPTPNGDGTKVVDLSPLRIALQKTANRGSLSHRRSDSQSTTSSRDGQCDQLSPGRDSEVMGDDPSYSGERRLSQETGSCILPTLSEEKLDPQQQQKVLKKLAELTEVLNARENKLVQLSKENLDLQETNSILRSQLQQVEAAREAELEDLNKVSTEFTQRLAESEKRVNQVIREKESVKKQLQRTQEDLEKKIKDKSLHNLLQEKDQQIEELMQEGEKLSKQQLQVNTIIKKLRVKEKENESLITSQKKKLEDQKSELDHLRKVCESKDELEKKQTEAIGQLNSAVQKQEREISKLKSDLEDAQERVRGLQTALDNSYKEIADLHRSNAAQDSKAHEAALSAEMQVREELKMQLDQERKAFIQEKDALIMQIEDLRLTLSRMEKEHNRREDMLRQEISDLQRHLQEDEARSQDLTQSVTSATRPLLRQIENLQSTYAAQSQSWEKVEKNLSERLADAQSQLATAVEKERSASEALMDLRSKVTSLETQISCLKQDKTQLTAQVDMLKTKLEVLEDSKNSDLAQLEATKQEMAKELSDVKKEKVFLEAQLDMEKTKVEQEKKKLVLAQDQIVQLEREIQRPVSRGSQSPLSISRTESLSGDTSAMFTSFTQDDLERSFVLSPSTTKTSLYDSLRHSGAAAVMENLQSQLKQREGEIVQLRDDIQQLERTRESMARELVNLTNQNEELQSQVEQLPQYKGKLEEVNGRYNALLQMYGEKVEEADELRMDLHDVKEMYKAQIDHLLAK